jgi:hypothetical protein
VFGGRGEWCVSKSVASMLGNTCDADQLSVLMHAQWAGLGLFNGDLLAIWDISYTVLETVFSLSLPLCVCVHDKSFDLIQSRTCREYPCSRAIAARHERRASPGRSCTLNSRLWDGTR